MCLEREPCKVLCGLALQHPGYTTSLQLGERRKGFRNTPQIGASTPCIERKLGIGHGKQFRW